MEMTLNTKDSNSQKYSLEWDDIENEEIDYDFYLDEIENFFREDFENDILDQEDIVFSNNL